MEVESVQDPSDLAEDPQSGGDTDQDWPCWQARSSAGLGLGKQAEIPEPGCEIVACVLLFRKILLMPSEAMPIRISSEFSRELTNGLEDSSLVTITEQIRFPRLVGHLECGHSRGADSALIGRVGTLARLESVVSCAPSRHASRDSNEGDIDDVDDGSHGWADVTIFGAARFKIVALEPTSGLFHAIARIRVLPDEGSGSLTRIPFTATSIPDFVRQAFDPVSLCARIVASGSRLLRPFGKEDLAENFVLPRTRMETEKFSFWLARNLPLDMRTVRALLELNSTEHRLLEILKFVTGVEETLSCAFCNAALATTANVISMSEVGAAGSYMNAFGCTHQLLTLDKVPDARSRGAPVLEHTYFPGYAWTCIYCYQCEFHIGWKYEAVDTSCIPREFFGLLRSVLTTNLPGRHWL
ncbi:Protein cereblon [Hondaea fermentalgiana]|uniref:Protein cereblon n=1 Tax=Hondaea fermentalgiana TaxID=2315210 RepID=A0A2R5GV28_9STRA|nr:Protein cereblon [Hondaea fermentalgiana]|eukprot:GBG32251.1 Protein cereblon [Hondaea fermentalgiana]